MSNPFPLVLEENLPFFNLTGGTCTVYEGAAPAPFPDVTPAPINNIRTDQPWGMAVTWTTSGVLNHLLAGNWILTCYMEQMGGAEFSLPGNTYTVPFVSAPHTYNHVFHYSPGTCPPGAYRVVMTAAMAGPAGYRGPVAAVGEGPLLQFYKVGT